MSSLNELNLDTLLMAADYLDRVDFGQKRSRESEHGYASMLPVNPPRPRRITSRKSQGNRYSHNELEKNRRAYLRHCLERLREILPSSTSESGRHTMLALLLRARTFIRNLEDKQKRHVQIKTDLEREQRQLRRRLEQLTKGSYRTRYERSVSECSTSALSTTSSFSSECDEVDIVGCGSLSDTDDHGSNSSDGGYTVNSRS